MSPSGVYEKQGAIALGDTTIFHRSTHVNLRQMPGMLILTLKTLFHRDLHQENCIQWSCVLHATICSRVGSGA